MPTIQDMELKVQEIKQELRICKYNTELSFDRLFRELDGGCSVLQDAAFEEPRDLAIHTNGELVQAAPEFQDPVWQIKQEARVCRKNTLESFNKLHDFLENL